MKNHHSTQRKCQCICSTCKVYFLTEKNMTALCEFILQMVMYLHTSSHVKPGRVKIHMQMGAGRKKHKNNELHHLASFSLLCWTRISLRRSGGQFKERKKKRIIEYEKEVLASDCGFWQLRDTVATLPDTLYRLIKNLTHQLFFKIVNSKRCFILSNC